LCEQFRLLSVISLTCYWSIFFSNIPGHVLTTLVELTQCYDQTVGHGGKHKTSDDSEPRMIRQGKDQIHVINSSNIR